ncbi:Gp49 family protein [Amorphus sp. MBR-141]
MSRNEAEFEAESQAKGLTAPRLSPRHIDEQIVAEAFHVFPGTTLTICALTLRNGYHVTGESAAASSENFDAELGRKIARDNARNKIWSLEGYLLRSRLAGMEA